MLGDVEAHPVRDPGEVIVAGQGEEHVAAGEGRGVGNARGHLGRPVAGGDAEAPGRGGGGDLGDVVALEAADAPDPRRRPVECHPRQQPLEAREFRGEEPERAPLRHVDRVIEEGVEVVARVIAGDAQALRHHMATAEAVRQDERGERLDHGVASGPGCLRMPSGVQNRPERRTSAIIALWRRIFSGSR